MLWTVFAASKRGTTAAQLAQHAKSAAQLWAAVSASALRAAAAVAAVCQTVVSWSGIGSNTVQVPGVAAWWIESSRDPLMSWLGGGDVDFVVSEGCKICVIRCLFVSNLYVFARARAYLSTRMLSPCTLSSFQRTCPLTRTQIFIYIPSGNNVWRRACLFTYFPF